MVDILAAVPSCVLVLANEALDAGAGSRARNNYAAFLYAQGRYLEAAAVFREVTTDTL